MCSQRGRGSVPAATPRVPRRRPRALLTLPTRATVLALLTLPTRAALLALLALLASPPRAPAAPEEWLQLKFDARHSGNVPERTVRTPLGLVGAVPLTDAVFTAPVVAGGRAFVVDGSGVAFAIDAGTLDVLWTFRPRGGNANASNVSSPAICGRHLHYGTTAGLYYVLDRETGKVVREIDCRDPIFGAPVVANGRIYFATLGATVYALEPDGRTVWTWDFVREVIGFSGDRWDGMDWYAHKQGRVTWKDHFCSSRDLAVHGRNVVLPAGGRTVFLEDAGEAPRLVAVGLIPRYAGTEYAAAFGQAIGEDGSVYVQWHRRDNAGRVEILRLVDGEVRSDHVPGTQTAINLPGLLGFSSVSIRGADVYRCRPEEGFGLARHSPGSGEAQPLGGYPSIASPILLRDAAVFGGLDGRLHVIPLGDRGETIESVESGERVESRERVESGEAWSFATAFGKAISAPVCVSGGRIYFGCEDGYLYVLGAGGDARLPTRDLELERIRTPLGGKLAAAEHDWYTNYGDLQNTNVNAQGLEPPLRIRWIRRYEGTFKHIPVCGGGRLYTHTSEGQVFAVEQETGRLLWRRYWPGVYLSFTSPIYFRERLLVPQAGMRESRMRCLDAATGRLIWETPFTGSPSWSRQAPPILHENLAIYASGSGKYAPQGNDKAFVMQGDPRESPNGEEVMSFIYTHDNPYYPRDNKPLVWAWDVATGETVWTRDFSDIGAGGNDSGLCLMDGVLYYSTFFGYSAEMRRRRGLPDGPNGLTAALDPKTGKVLWKTTDHSVTAGCTISARDGRLYLGGYNRPDESTTDRHVFCLDAKDGSLVWRSDPVRSAVNVVTVGQDFVFSNASGHDGHLIDKETGKILSRFNLGYACTRFTCSWPYVLGANMDLIDISDGNRLVSTGPCVDSRECVGSAVSNGRIFYTSQASGLQCALLWGKEAESTRAPWERDG